MDQLNIEKIISCTWHWKVEDNLSWSFCCSMLNQDYNIQLSPSELKKNYQNFFINVSNHKIYTKCPICDGEIVPRKSRYGYFVSCSNFPKCKFKGVKK